MQEYCQVDLTQITSSSERDRDVEIVHEVEVEYRFPAYLYAEKEKWERGEKQRFRELINVMVNTVRGLSRKSISHA